MLLVAEFCHHLRTFELCLADALVTGAGWDYLRTRQKLQRDIDTHATAVRTERLAALQTKAKVRSGLWINN